MSIAEKLSAIIVKLEKNLIMLKQSKYIMPQDDLYEDFNESIKISMSTKYDNSYPLVIKPTVDCSGKDLNDLLNDINTDDRFKYYYIVFTFDVMSTFIDILKEKSFEFHHMSENKENPARQESMVFYYDKNKVKGHQKVQAYSTSTQGIGATLISSDNYYIVANEKGKMKAVSGSIDEKKSVYETIKNELLEEIGYTMDKEDKVYFLSGHVYTKHKDEKQASNFKNYIIKSNSKTKDNILESFSNKTDTEVSGIAAFYYAELQNLNFLKPDDLNLTAGDFKFNDDVYKAGKSLLEKLHYKFKHKNITLIKDTKIKNAPTWLDNLDNFLFDGNALEILFYENPDRAIIKNNRINVFVQSLIDELKQQLGRDPNNAEIAEFIRSKNNGTKNNGTKNNDMFEYMEAGGSRHRRRRPTKKRRHTKKTRPRKRRR